MNLKRFLSKTIIGSIAALFSCLSAESTYSQHQLLWKFATGAAIHSSAVTNTNRIYFGSADSNFYALDKASGKLSWKFKTKGPIHSSPAIYQDKVLFSSADGKIYGLNKDNGKIVWTYQTNGEKVYDVWDYYLSSPIVDNNIAYVGSGDSCIYALNIATGKKLWSYKTNGVVHAAPVIKDGVVFIGSYDGSFYALQSTTGKLIWKFKTVGDLFFPKGEIQKAALIHDNAVIFGSRDYNIYALDLKTGTGHWNMKEGGSWIIASPFFYKDNIYFGTSDTHRFYCMNAKSGQIKWTLPLSMRVYGSATVMNGEIVFGCFNGKIYFVDPESGAVKSTFQTDESKKAYASIFDENDKIKKEINLYGPDHIKAEKRILALGAILSSPFAEDQILYFGDANGFFYALSPTSN
jgi:outer membrane protein assembly factor BamB